MPGPQSIRWALSNLPELPCTWPFSCPWGPRDYCRERPRCLGQPEPGTVNSPEEKLSWPKNPGVTPETSGGEVGGGGQRGREGNVNVQHPELAPGGRPGSYCPEPPAHGAGAHPGRFRSSPGRQRQGAVSEGRRPALEALPASPLLEGRETEHSVLLTEASRLPGAHIRPMTLTESSGDRQAGRQAGRQTDRPSGARAHPQRGQYLGTDSTGVSLCL